MRVIRENCWNPAGHCHCGCRAFYATKLTIWEWIAFKTGLWKRADLSVVKAVNAPLGGEAKQFKAVWEGITASLEAEKESENGQCAQ